MRAVIFLFAFFFLKKKSIFLGLLVMHITDEVFWLRILRAIFSKN